MVKQKIIAIAMSRNLKKNPENANELAEKNKTLKPQLYCSTLNYNNQPDNDRELILHESKTMKHHKLQNILLAVLLK